MAHQYESGATFKQDKENQHKTANQQKLPFHNTQIRKSSNTELQFELTKISSQKSVGSEILSYDDAIGYSRIQEEILKCQQYNQKNASKKKCDMQLSLWSFFNPANGRQNKSSRPNTQIWSQCSDSEPPNDSNLNTQVFVERSMTDPTIQIRMNKKIYNTTRHLMQAQNDYEKMKIMQEEDSGSKQSWLIDTELIEINKQLWRRKNDCKQQLIDVLGKLI